MRRLLALITLCALIGAASAQPDKPAAPKAPFPALPETDAWDKLPPAKKPALPEWARVLAGPMPKTTAKLLELDYLHRARSPLDPVLAAAIRVAVADALGSEYGKATALADLDRARPREDEFGYMEKIFCAVRFAKKLTLAGHAITDEEFEQMLKLFTPAQVTAIVHTVAYANFHNRLILALGVKGENPVAEPIALPFDLDGAKVKAPERPSWDDLKSAKGDGIAVRVEWSDKEFDALNKTLDKQKERKLRIPLPDKSAFEKLTPREKDSADKIRWNTVSMGYQPEMTRAWFAALYAFYDEAKVDRVFTNSMFWVVTRTNDCFY
jgi:alkylhydroperoxidase family enzyme